MTTSLGKFLLPCIALSIALAAPAAVHAQFGGLSLPKVGGGDTQAPSVDKEAFTKSTNDVADTVVSVRLKSLDAQAALMEALGLKSDSVAKAAQDLRGKQGGAAGDKLDALKASLESTADADRELLTALAGSRELSADSKAKFAEAAGKMIEGLLAEKDQTGAIQKLVADGKALVSSGSAFEKLDLMSLVKPVTALSSMVPQDLSAGSAVIGKILDFAKANNITSIPNAEKALSSLTGM
jgi:hypothetical protein